MIDRLISFVAPHSCYGCGEVGTVLCHYCTNDIIEEPFEACLFCLSPASQGSSCASCLARNKLDGVWCVGERRDPLKAVLDAYKFDRVRAAHTTCVQLLDDAVPVLDADWTVTSVPSAASHARQRGYAHMELVAQRFARGRSLPYSELLRHHGNQTQHFKNKRERAENAKASLAVIGSAPKVLLIDDILTTGATLEVAIGLLRGAGVKQLAVAVIARQPLDGSADL